jgi:hypothetical protein
LSVSITFMGDTSTPPTVSTSVLHETLGKWYLAVTANRQAQHLASRRSRS